jgi:LPS export ABC transporter protein LptC
VDWNAGQTNKAGVCGWALAGNLQPVTIPEEIVSSSKVIQGIILTVVLGLSLVLAVGAWKGRIQKKPLVSPENGASPQNAEMKLTDMEFTEMQDGRRFWTLSSSEAKYSQDEQKSALKEVRLTFFMENGEEIFLTSREGILYAGTKNVELSESVRVELPRGFVLTTEKAVYNHQMKLISSDTAIQLAGPGVQLGGNRWQFRIPDRTASVEGGVKAVINTATVAKIQN